MWRLKIAAIAGTVAFLLSAARADIGAQTVPQPPALRINDPFAAPLWRIDVDANEIFVAAGSPAKAASVWTIDSGGKPDLLRVPLRAEEIQRAHAVALSPDARFVAYSVPPLRDERGLAKPGTAVIYVMERSGGQIVKAVEGVETRPQALRFSPDGQYLAAALSDGCGLRLWRTADWTLAAKDDEDYGGEGGSCCPVQSGGTDCDPFPDTTGLAFTGAETGAWLVTSGDTGVRAYALEGTSLKRLIFKRPDEIGLERPEGIAISPDKTRIAVADARLRGKAADRVRLQIALLDLDTLTPLREALQVPDSALLSPSLLDTAKTPAANQMSLNRVAWGTDESGREHIFAGGVLWCQIAEPRLVTGQVENEALDNCMVRFSLTANPTDAENVRFIRAGTERIMDIAFLPKRQAVLYASQQKLAVITLNGEPYANEAGETFAAQSLALDLRDRRLGGDAWLNFAISDDGATVYAEDYRSSGEAHIGLKFDIANLRLERLAAPPEGLKPADRDPVVIDSPGNWWNQQRPPVIYGLPLDVLAGVKDTYRAVALAPGQRAVIASANFIRVAAYDGGTARILCELRVAAEAYRAAVTPDGSLTVIGHSDGTLRWYRIEDKGSDACELTPLLAVHIRRTDASGDTWSWMAWLPATGKFASDGRSKDLLAWQTAAPGGQVNLVRFADLLKFYAPSEVKEALRWQATLPDAAANLEKSVAEAAGPAPIMVLAPEPGAMVETETVRFDLKLGSNLGQPQKLLVVTGDGERAAKAKGSERYGPNDPVELQDARIASLDVTLPKSVRRYQRNVDICFQIGARQTCQPIHWMGPPEKPPARRLHAIITGFSQYSDSRMILPYAQNDALDLAKLFIADYQARVIDKTSATPPDFESIEIDLFVSPSSETAKAELAELAKLPYVHLHTPDARELAVTLSALRQRLASSGAASDLVLFYFSGHGLIHPYNRDKGLTVLLGPGIDASYSAETLAANAMTSDELIAGLEAVAAEKIVAIDACRTTAAIPGARGFDPAAVSLEFENRALSVNFFFSALPGQYSLDQNYYAFSEKRPPENRGNGLFTYALLKALTGGDAPLSVSASEKIEVGDIDRYLRRFFDQNREESAAQKLVALLRQQGIGVNLQQPLFIAARRTSLGAPVVIRTLDARN